MAFAVNHVRFEGNLLGDPEMRYSAKGTSVLKFRFAHNVRRKDEAGEWGDEPIYLGVTMFGKEADDLGPILTKGQRVVVEGRLDPPRTYEGKSGTQVGLDIVADRVLLVTRPPRAEGAPATPVAAAAGADLEDLPF